MSTGDEGPRDVGPASSFGIVTERDSDRVFLRLRGDLDLGSEREFERAVIDACEGPAQTIVVDLSTLDFLDSHGLRVILGAQRRCEEAQCALSVIPGEQAQRLFELTGLNERLPIVGSDGASADGAVKANPE
jgi:anti-sigma B factor antagonist